MTPKITIGVDFDGTVVEHDFPRLGAPVPRALETLHGLQGAGHRLILWTMRSGAHLDQAVEYLRDAGIDLYGVNHNPGQEEWTSSPKAYCTVYIDDAALGCPLLYPGIRNGKLIRPFVDWVTVAKMATSMGWL